MGAGNQKTCTTQSGTGSVGCYPNVIRRTPVISTHRNGMLPPDNASAQNGMQLPDNFALTLVLFSKKCKTIYPENNSK
jgi:hypothetical protein